MFAVLLHLRGDKDTAAQHAPAHQEWIRHGLDDGVFLLVGNLRPGPGGAILAHGTSAEELRARVAADPFVAEGVVDAEIVEISPHTADDRLKFLLA